MTKWQLTIIYVMCLGYALIRYSFFGPIASVHWPAYIANKSFALFAIVMLLLSCYAYFKGQQEQHRAFGRIAWHMMVIHIGLSVVLFSPGYYRAFYGANALRLSLLGELVLISGVLAIVMFWQIPKYSGVIQHRLKQLGCALAFGHILPTSVPSKWLQPTEWYGYLPPIGLVTAIMALLAFLYMTRYRQKNH